MTAKDIEDFLDKYNDYDIRTNHNCRFVDQKCTPDIVCFIADCVLSTDCATKTFTVKDLWETEFFIKNTRVAFHKPYADDPSAHNEYNKVLCQPLKMFAYAHILDVTKSAGKLMFKVRDTQMLEYIASRERNTFLFLQVFFRKIMESSGTMRFYNDYKTSCEGASKAEIREAKCRLYGRYHAFIAANTPTKSKKDSDRILHKVLNVFAYTDMIPGSSGKVHTWEDLMYNKINKRDKGTGKDKTKTRKEARKDEIDEINANFFIEYQVNKAIKNVRKHEGDVSEVHDELATGIATEVHHIFPRSAFPMIASYYENLILLTASQHHQKAHPKGNTQLVSKDYQLTCLMSKSMTIEKSINSGDTFYNKGSFIYVINTGLSENLKEQLSFPEIRKFLVNKYLSL